jgi:hypothetical protein
MRNVPPGIRIMLSGVAIERSIVSAVTIIHAIQRTRQHPTKPAGKETAGPRDRALGEQSASITSL